MVRPTRRAVGLLAATLPLAVLAALPVAGGRTIWLAAALAIGAAVALDAARLPGGGKMQVRIDAPDQIRVGAEVPAQVGVHAAFARGTRAALVLEAADPIEAAAPARVRFGPDGLVADFALAARRRGRGRLERCWLTTTGPLGLARRTVVLSLGRQIEAIPDVRVRRGAAFRAFEARDARVGVKVERYDGDGSEFDALREFRAGDDHRAIDWKATARHRTVLRRQFRAERDHDVVVAVDAGRMMAERLEGIPKLDVSVAAALRLAFVALETGDRAGFYGFDERPRVATAPRGGLRAFAAIQRAAAGLEPRDVETNFTLSLATLLESLKRRTLVLVLTDFSDTISAELMLENLARLGRRHVVVFVAIDDPKLGSIELAPPVDRGTLDKAVLAGTIRRERRIVLDRLKRLGIASIVAPAERVGAEMIDRYLELKRREAV